MNRKRFCLAVLGVLCLVVVSLAGAKLPEKPIGRVSDFAEMLTESAEDALQRLAESVETATGAQMAMVTVPSLDGLTVDDYTNQLFKQWKVGHKGQDDGVMFLVSLKEHKARIEVGYGLEGVLNDAKVGRILDYAVMPLLEVGNWEQGILDGSVQIAQAIMKDKTLVKTPPATSEPLPRWLKIVFPIGLGLFVTGGFLACGAGMRGDILSVFWGAGFGGIPLLLGYLAAPAMGYPRVMLPAWGLLMLVLGILFGKKYLARYGGKWKVRVSIGFGGGSSSGSKSGGGFGGGSSGGGGASR